MNGLLTIAVSYNHKNLFCYIKMIIVKTSNLIINDNLYDYENVNDIIQMILNMNFSE